MNTKCYYDVEYQHFVEYYQQELGCTENEAVVKAYSPWKMFVMGRTTYNPLWGYDIAAVLIWLGFDEYNPHQP